jgi:formylglycine-generating enzyme required for sulfatase activity
MTNNQPKPTGVRFTPAFLVVLLPLFLFASCSQPTGGSPGTGQPPGIPTELVVMPGYEKLIVSWQAVLEAGSYEVFCEETEPGAEDTPKQTVNVPAAVIPGLTNDTPYHVWVRAANSAGTSAPSSSAQETPSASVPEGFVSVPGKTVTGSGGYAFTVTVPYNSAYTNPGSTSVRNGVFVEGRTVPIDSFIMAEYETTQELWYTVQNWAIKSENGGYQFQNKKDNPSVADKKKPVAVVSWRDAIVWCNAYSEKEGKDPVYTYQGTVIRDSRNTNAAACDGADMDKTKNGYRLPTEAEREFAARGGDPGKPEWMYMYAGSDNADLVAWYHGNSPYTVQDVGQKGVNRLGIYDLSGNVQEWCWDWMNPFADVTSTTGVNGATYSDTPPLVNQKAFNGGGVGSNITYSCVTYRWGYTPDYADSIYGKYIGFRVVRTP